MCFRGRRARSRSTCRRQYDPAKPACVYVDQDGVQFERPRRPRQPDRARGAARHHRRLRDAGRRQRRRPQGGARPLQPQLRVRRTRGCLLPVAAGRGPARGGDEVDRGRPAGAPLPLRQRPRDRGLEQRRHRGVQCGVGASRGLQPGLQRHRHLHRPARRRQVTRPLSASTSRSRSASSCRTARRPEHLRRRLVDGQPDDGAGAGVLGLRGEPRVGRRPPQRKAHHVAPSRRAALGLEGLAEGRGEGRRAETPP